MGSCPHVDCVYVLDDENITNVESACLYLCDALHYLQCIRKFICSWEQHQWFGSKTCMNIVLWICCNYVFVFRACFVNMTSPNGKRWFFCWWQRQRHTAVPASPLFGKRWMLLAYSYTLRPVYDYDNDVEMSLASRACRCGCLWWEDVCGQVSPDAACLESSKTKQEWRNIHATALWCICFTMAALPVVAVCSSLIKYNSHSTACIWYTSLPCPCCAVLCCGTQLT